jgi:hypothetical protein
MFISKIHSWAKNCHRRAQREKPFTDDIKKLPPRRKGPRYPSNRRLDGSQKQAAYWVE